MTEAEKELTISFASTSGPGGHVSGLLTRPAGAPRACLVLAHGAGAGMTHRFMEATAGGLSAHGIACLRYQFPYMQAGSRRPDRPASATETVRAAVAAAVSALPGVPMFAGGKSFGGRMTSTAQAASPMPGVRGLVFLGFPLHPAGKPGTARAEHLGAIRIPMMSVQGTRDALADLALLRPILAASRPPPTLLVVDGADHSFHVARPRTRTSGQLADPPAADQSFPPAAAVSNVARRTDADVLAEILTDVAAWMEAVPGA